ncbi:MAG: AGE family epimerase/isomerase [Bacteroidales bacterium]|nr:AGE family epimerase/isomerase [Bacteroidales bacterium]
MNPQVTQIKARAEKLLESNILPFWAEKMIDRERGGFYGRISGTGETDRTAPKGLILNARILWSFSAAYRYDGKPEWLRCATRAKDYLLEHFLDKANGGLYWSVSHLGEPLDTKKHFYAQAFAVYGLSEYCMATGKDAPGYGEALDAALRLYDLMQTYGHDEAGGGYIEACTRDWGEAPDMRLSDLEPNDAKTTNTHLHILEAYANLYRVSPSESLRKSIEELVLIFTDKIIDPKTGHLALFFEMDWKRTDNEVSFGHDIETSWLLYECALLLEDKEITERVREGCRRLYEASLEGLQSDHSMIYHIDGRGKVNMERHWWVQAETVLGMLWQHKVNGTDLLPELDCALSYIEERLTDREGGEWFWSVMPDGSVNRSEDKAGPWKCPYHNSRMCLHLLKM